MTCLELNATLFFLPTMLTTTIARRVPRINPQVLSRVQRRNAGGAPHFNEPSGYFLGEKVRNIYLLRSPFSDLYAWPLFNFAGDFLVCVP